MSSSSHAKNTRRLPSARKAKRQGGLRSYETRVPRGPNRSPLSERLRCTLRYAESIGTNTAAVGGYAEYLWNLNSLNDPNRTGAGHQPMGYDQITALYGRYRVESVRITIHSTSRKDNDTPMQMSMCADNGTSTFTGCADAFEHAYSKLWQHYPGSDPAVTTMVVPLWQLTGQLRPSYDADSSYQAAVGSSPTELLILHVGYDNPAGVQAYFMYTILFEFDCEFWDPVQLGQS